MHLKQILAACVFAGSAALPSANAATISTFYGDDDGFGIGTTSGTINATVSNAGPGEAPFTDVRLIGTGFFSAPAFTPTGGFTPFVIPGGATITGASLTIRFGSFTPTSPVDGPNILLLDGVDFSSFIGTFTANLAGGDAIQTLSLALPSTFFASLADGAVSLAGTRISEGSGFGSFQVDFLRLDITTSAVPEPAELALFGIGLIGLFAARRRSRTA